MKYVKCHKVEEKPSYPLYSDKEYEEVLEDMIEWAHENEWDVPLYLVDVLLNAKYRYNRDKEKVRLEDRCDKCTYAGVCSCGNPLYPCPNYKYDAPDGGYYG